MASTNRAELEASEAALHQFRVNELHILLSTFKCPKLGKKIELIQSASRRHISAGPSTMNSVHYGQMDGTNMINNPPVYSHIQMAPQNVVHQQFMNSAPPFSSQLDRAKMVRIVDLPFYDKQHTLLELSELPPNISGIRSVSRSAFLFSLPPEIKASISYRNDSTVLPRIEIQLRLFLLDYSKEQSDDFPPNCVVKIDDVPVTLPNVIPTNKPNAEAKRPSRPVNITSYCQSSAPSFRPHRIFVEWMADKRAWAIGIFVVNKLTSDILLRRLLTNVNARRGAEDMKRFIKNRLSANGKDDGIELDSVKVSLLCPLGKTRVLIPVKSVDCTHMQCFDLANFLKMNEKKPTWKCTICDKPAAYKRLVVDEYFEEILRDVDPGITEVGLRDDGSWFAIIESCESASDDDEYLDSSQVRMSHPETTRTHIEQSITNCDDDDIIVLDSDDEVEEILKSSRRNSTKISKKDIYRNKSGSGTQQPVICIDLEDCDPVDLSPHLGGNSQLTATSVIPSTTISNFSCASSQILQPPSGFLHQAPIPTNVPVPYFNAGQTAIPQPIPTSSAYFHSLPFSQYRQEYSSHSIEQELRNFISNIQRSNDTPQFPRYS